MIGRDHLDSGSVASLNRETKVCKMVLMPCLTGHLLNALLNTASGATWVSLHHGSGVGMGFSQHSGMVIVWMARMKRQTYCASAAMTWTEALRQCTDRGYDIAIRVRRKSNLR